MKITLRETKCGYLVVAEDGRDRFVQFESDKVGLAESFGWRDADALGVAGFLDACEGRWIDDPGYFD